MTEPALSSLDLAAFDPVGWHYAELLAQRAKQAAGPTQDLLKAKQAKVLRTLTARFEAAKASGKHSEQPSGQNSGQSRAPERPTGASPLAQLLSDMSSPARNANASPKGAWRAESPQIQEFRKQLGNISVQKKVSQAMAQAPQNAGPINSHMLVLRSLACMREVSPDYLNRFMVYLDTLLCLDEASAARPLAKKPSGTPARQK